MIVHKCSCGKAYRVSDGALGKRIKCSACGVISVVQKTASSDNSTIPTDTPERCPSCGGVFASHQVLCLGCGYDRRTQSRRQIQTPLAGKASDTPSQAPPSFRKVLKYVAVTGSVVVLITVVVVMIIALRQAYEDAKTLNPAWICSVQGDTGKIFEQANAVIQTKLSTEDPDLGRHRHSWADWSYVREFQINPISSLKDLQTDWSILEKYGPPHDDRKILLQPDMLPQWDVITPPKGCFPLMGCIILNDTRREGFKEFEARVLGYYDPTNMTLRLHWNEHIEGSGPAEFYIRASLVKQTKIWNVEALYVCSSPKRSTASTLFQSSFTVPKVLPH